ncbi:MAG: hypothetical protein IJT77_00075 [Clostridia bacterium]|nr:hypothetical protein [Clostridia bacterium]
MKDYTQIKSEISIPAGKEAELDELLQDTELVGMIEKMCMKSDVDLPRYLQFLMEQKVPGNLRLHEFAKQLVAQAMKSRPWIFL